MDSVGVWVSGLGNPGEWMCGHDGKPREFTYEDALAEVDVFDFAACFGVRAEVRAIPPGG